MNDNDRSQWIDNDEYLYNLWKSSHQSKKDFIKENRDLLTQIIRDTMHNDRKPHTEALYYWG